MDNALARLLGQEPLESLDGPGKEHMIDEILNVLSHAEDEGSSSSQENTPQHTTQHTTPPVITKQTLPSLSTILATTGAGKKDTAPALNTTAASVITTLGYQAPFTVPTVTTGNLGSLAFKASSNPLALPPYQTVTVRTSSVEGDIEDGEGDGDDVESALSSEDDEDSPSPGTTPVKLPSFPTLTSTSALRYSDSSKGTYISVAQLAKDNLTATHEYLRSSLPSAHSLQQFISQRSVASFPDAREVLAAKAEPLPESQPTYDQTAFLETTTTETNSLNRYQSPTVAEYITTTTVETKPKYQPYASPITRAAEVVTNTPTKSALHATLQGEYQTSSAADSSAEEETFRSYSRAAEPGLNVKTLPTRPAAPLDYLAAAAARYEYQHYPKGIALAKSSQPTDYKVAITTSPSTYRHTLPQTVQAAGLMSSAAFAYKQQLENEAKEAALLTSPNLSASSDKYIIPHDELALKTEVYGDRSSFEKDYSDTTAANTTITTSERLPTTLPSSDYILSPRDSESAAVQISRIQAALASHSQHIEAQAALAKMHHEIVKTSTTSASQVGNGTTVGGRQFICGTVIDDTPHHQSPAVTTTASHLEIMKLPKKRGRPPKGPEDFSPPLPTIPTLANTSPSSLSAMHQRSVSGTMPKYERPPPTRSPQVSTPPSRRDSITGNEQICMNCGQYFSSSLMFEKHVSSRTCERYKGPYNCPKCNKQFTRRFNLQLHLQKGCAKKKRNSYWPANKEEYEEYAALEQVKHKVQLNQGKRRSGVWHKCGKCGQAFTDAQVYNSHIAICLAGKKLFKCKYCPKQFSRRSGNLQIHMLTCPAKAAFEEAGGVEDDDIPPPKYNPYPQDPYRPPDQWSGGAEQVPRKKPRRPKSAKTQETFRSGLDMSIQAAAQEREFFPKMMMEPPPPFPPMPSVPPAPPVAPTLPPYQPPKEPEEPKFSHREFIEASELQQIILQREQELIKQERLVKLQEEQLQLEEQMAQEVPQQEEIVPPPIAVIENAIVAQDTTMPENSVSEVAANVAISTEPPPVEVPKKRGRANKRSSSREFNSPPEPNMPFIPQPQITTPKPIKMEEKPKAGTRKRRLSVEDVYQTLTRNTLSRMEQNQTRASKAKIQEQQVDSPGEVPGSKINYATTSITTENVISYKRQKRRPNYAAMNDDANDGGASRNHKPEVTPDVPPRTKRSRTSTNPRPVLKDDADDDDMGGEGDDDDDDDDAFTPKHVSRRAAKLKQENSEPDYVAISGGTSYRCKCGKVCRRQADITRHLEFCKFGTRVEKPYACACGLRYVNQVSVKRHQQLTQCIGFKMGTKGTTKVEPGTTPDQTVVKTEGKTGRRRVQMEQSLNDSASQEGSDSSFSADVGSGHGTPGSGSEATTSDAANFQDSPQKLAEHKKHYRCATCHRKFVNRKTYQRHKNIYCNNQTHECPTCKETFTSATVLGFHQMEHQEELPFGCSICGSKFKSASTLSRHRESHAQVKKPIKKLKIKIIDGSCVISKVDSPAGALREAQEDPTMGNQIKVENQMTETGEEIPMHQVTNEMVVVDPNHEQNNDQGESGETYMVEISTVEDNILMPGPNDIMDEADMVNHPGGVITENTTLPHAQSDIIEESVIDAENTLMISNEGGVVTFSDGTSAEETIESTDEYLVPVSAAQDWARMVQVANEQLPVVHEVPIATDTVEETSVIVRNEAPVIGAAVITEQITNSTIGGAPDISQLSALPQDENILQPDEVEQDGHFVKQDISLGLAAPESLQVVQEANLAERTSVIEIVPAAGKDNIDHGVETLKVNEVVAFGTVNNETQSMIPEVHESAVENGEAEK